MASHKRLHVLGQLRRRRHRRAFDQDRHHNYVGPREARGHFEAHEVEGIVQPSSPGRIARFEPLAANDDQHHPAGAQRALRWL